MHLGKYSGSLASKPKCGPSFTKFVKGILVLASRVSGSTSGTGTASALTPILTPGVPLTDGDGTAAISSVSSSDESVSSDSVVVSELTMLDSISARGCTLDSMEESLPPAASALGFL